MARKVKKTAKRVAKKSILVKKVDNRLSILLMVLALLVFALAAMAMSQ
jgi:hypothetical protein